MVCASAYVSCTTLEFINGRWLGAKFPYEKKLSQTNFNSDFRIFTLTQSEIQQRFSSIHSHEVQLNRTNSKTSQGRILFLSVPEIGHYLKRTSSVAFESDCFSTEKRWAGQGNPYPIGENDSGIMQTFRGRIPLHPRLCSSQFQAAQLKTGEG